MNYSKIYLENFKLLLLLLLWELTGSVRKPIRPIWTLKTFTFQLEFLLCGFHKDFHLLNMKSVKYVVQCNYLQFT